jgi:hypothetical protein
MTPRHLLAPLGLVILLGALRGSDPLPVGPAPPWPLDEVRSTNGAVYRGLILSESSAGIEFQVVLRNPGRPTLTYTTSFSYSKREIASVKRLTAADRAVLKEKLADLDPKGEGEEKRMETLELTQTDWPGVPGGARRYASEQFVLVSSAPEEVTRRSAVRLEQIYAAFARVLPPRRDASRPTTVLLAGSMADYRARIGPTAGPLLNAAIYDPAANRIVCGSDLGPLDEKLAAARAKQKEQRRAVRQYEAEMRQLYKSSKPELDRFLALAAKERQTINESSQANDSVFNAATGRLFALLYHEAFHSYAFTFAYPPESPERVRAGDGPGELPRWLNEGLAQIFETAVVEAGELRADYPDPARLSRVRDLMKKADGLVPLAELMRSGKPAFLAAHADERAAADRAYLTSWAVAFYLSVEKRLTGGPAFDTYLATINTGGDPVAAFETWVGQDLATFQKEWRDYLTRLDPKAKPAPG